MKVKFRAEWKKGKAENQDEDEDKDGISDMGSWEEGKKAGTMRSREELRGCGYGE